MQVKYNINMPRYVVFRSKYFHSPIAYVTPFRVGVHFGEDETTNAAAQTIMANNAEDSVAPGGIVGKLIFPLNIIQTIIFKILSSDLQKTNYLLLSQIMF